MGSFFSKGLDVFKFWDLQVFTWVGEKSVQGFSLQIYAKNLKDINQLCLFC